MNRSPALMGLATCEAPHPVAQSDAVEHVIRYFKGARFDPAAAAAIFANAGISQRTFALPLDAYFDDLSPENRNRRYLEVAGEMLRDAAERAVPPDLRSRVSHVVTVSTTGIATPSLDVDVIQALGLDPRVRRVPVFGLGCAGGVAGLQMARDLALSQPDGLVLLLCVELTSLTLLSSDKSLRNFVACALFGDGAAAALIGAPDPSGAPPLAALGPGVTRLFPDTKDLMGWDVRPDGWRVIFAPRIPSMVAEHISSLFAEVADRRDVRHFVMHPGGRKILEAYRTQLDLDDTELAASTGVLEDHGNMSAATVFFVLERSLQGSAFRPGPGVLCAFGPGFTAELMPVELLGNGAQ